LYFSAGGLAVVADGAYGIFIERALDPGRILQVYEIRSAAARPPTITAVAPGTGRQGDTIADFTVTGTDFQATSAVSFSGGGISVDSYISRTATQIVASISIQPDRAVGPVDLTVTNPDGQRATAARFEVVPRCTLTVTSSATTVAAICGGGLITITTGPACHWSVTSNVDWLQPVAVEGEGSATVPFSTAINLSSEARIGRVFFGSGAIFIEQLGQSQARIDRIDPTVGMLSGLEVSSELRVLAATTVARRSGVAADGVARLVLRLSTAAPGSATFSLVNERCEPLAAGDENGVLTDRFGHEPASSVVTATTQIDSDIRAFSIYQSPKRFVRASRAQEDSVATERSLFVRVQLQGVGGVAIDTAVPIRIVRPPVILIHGLWSDPSAFDSLVNVLSAGPFHIDFANYEHCPDDPLFVKCNSRPIKVAADTVNGEIRMAIREFRRAEDVAAVQANLVGHSMGALIARQISTRPDFTNDPLLPTFGAGSIHRLISVDAPHLGSNLANVLLSDRCLAITFGRLLLPVGNGAVSDLRGYPGAPSRTIRRLVANPSSFPVHSIVGLASAGETAAFTTLVAALNRVFGCSTFAVDSVLGPDNDVIVSDVSERAGQAAGAADTTFDNVVHSSFLPGRAVLDDPRVVELIRRLLDAGERLYAALPRIP